MIGGTMAVIGRAEAGRVKGNKTALYQVVALGGVF